VKRTIEDWRAVKPEAVYAAGDPAHTIKVMEQMRADILELGETVERLRGQTPVPPEWGDK